MFSLISVKSWFIKGVQSVLHLFAFMSRFTSIAYNKDGAIKNMVACQGKYLERVSACQ